MQNSELFVSLGDINAHDINIFAVLIQSKLYEAYVNKKVIMNHSDQEEAREVVQDYITLGK